MCQSLTILMIHFKIDDSTDSPLPLYDLLYQIPLMCSALLQILPLAVSL